MVVESNNYNSQHLIRAISKCIDTIVASKKPAPHATDAWRSAKCTPERPVELVNLFEESSQLIGAALSWSDAPPSVVRVCKSCFVACHWNALECCAMDSADLSSEALVNSLRDLRSEILLGEPRVALVDSEMICWYTLEHYSETILGIGISYVTNGQKLNLSTDGALISKGSFDSGLRQSPSKTPFEAFLPVWICPSHSSSRKDCLQWKDVLCERICILGQALTDLESKGQRAVLPADVQFAGFVLRIYPDLINMLIVRMMQPDSDVRASERTFRVLVDFWRTFMYLAEEFPLVKLQAVEAIRQFVYDPIKRSKEFSPNIGWLTAMRTIVPHELVPFDLYFNEYVKESSLRSVMWWNKDGVVANADTVFSATKVSRHLLLFQTILIRSAFGRLIDELHRTAALADVTECKLDRQCHDVMTIWKEIISAEERMEATAVPGVVKWDTFFKNSNCTAPYEGVYDVEAWIQDLKTRASVTPGYFFAGRGGHGSGGRQSGGGRGGRAGGHHSHWRDRGRGGHSGRW